MSNKAPIKVNTCTWVHFALIGKWDYTFNSFEWWLFLKHLSYLCILVPFSKQMPFVLYFFFQMITSTLTMYHNVEKVSTCNLLLITHDKQNDDQCITK